MHINTTVMTLRYFIRKSLLQFELRHCTVYEIDYTSVVQWSVLGCDQLDRFLSGQAS